MATGAASISRGIDLPAGRFHQTASAAAWWGAFVVMITLTVLTAGSWAFSYRIGTEVAYARRDGRGGISMGAFRGNVRLIAGWADGRSAVDQEPDPPDWPAGLQLARYPITKV